MLPKIFLILVLFIGIFCCYDLNSISGMECPRNEMNSIQHGENIY